MVDNNLDYQMTFKENYSVLQMFNCLKQPIHKKQGAMEMEVLFLM